MYPTDWVEAPKRRNMGYTDAIRALRVGESVLLPINASTANSLLSKMYRRGERSRGTMTARDQVEGGCRVWRLSDL